MEWQRERCYRALREKKVCAAGAPGLNASADPKLTRRQSTSVVLHLSSSATCAEGGWTMAPAPPLIRIITRRVILQLNMFGVDDGIQSKCVPS